MIAELRHAYLFDCGQCGATNYLPAATPHFTLEEAAELREVFGMTDSGPSVLTEFPSTVTCEKCKTIHDAQPIGVLGGDL